MKRLIILIALNAMIVLDAQSQANNRKSEFQIYLTGGIKFLQPKYFDHTANISPVAVPTIGGGALWQVKKFQVGGEFNYTDGKKQTPDWGTIFTGINFNLIGGYGWNMGQHFRFNFQTGFGYSLYHLTLTDKNYRGSSNLNTAIYHNFIYSVPVSGMITRINANGTFFGVRVGYNFNIIPNEWRYMEGKHTEVFTASNDGFYLQIVFGGLLQLKDTNL